jgi:YesN/AraC family two-component response regulator
MPSLLICDDEPDSIAGLLPCFGKQAIHIKLARAGQDALNKARSDRPDLILLDVCLPGMDGFSVCERLKTDPLTQEIPVIFLSNRNGLDDKLRGFAVGAVDYITKPFAEAEVLARVGVHLHARQQMRQIKCLANLQAVDFDPANDPREKKFQRALALLEERLTNPPGLFELARAVGANERKLTELFRQRVGLSVFDYVSKRRLECSRQLLEDSSLQVRQIADQLGYKNPGDFTRAFRRHFGVTPREYRRSVSADDQ